MRGSATMQSRGQVVECRQAIVYIVAREKVFFNTCTRLRAKRFGFTTVAHGHALRAGHEALSHGWITERHEPHSWSTVPALNFVNRTARVQPGQRIIATSSCCGSRNYSMKRLKIDSAKSRSNEPVLAAKSSGNINFGPLRNGQYKSPRLPGKIYLPRWRFLAY